MKTILLIIVIGLLVMLAAVGWLILIAILFKKKVKNKDVLKRYLQIYMGFSALILLISCSPGTMIGSGYLVTIEKGIMTHIKRYEESAKVDSFIHARTGLTFHTDSLIFPVYPYFGFRNGMYFIYVERQGIYEKNGRISWKVYDEKLKN